MCPPTAHPIRTDARTYESATTLQAHAPSRQHPNVHSHIGNIHPHTFNVQDTSRVSRPGEQGGMGWGAEGEQGGHRRAEREALLAGQGVLGAGTSQKVDYDSREAQVSDLQQALLRLKS